MGLKAVTINAVGKVKTALGDLAVDLVLRKRVQAAYVPGSPVEYTVTNFSVKGVISKYRSDEIDGTMIKADDAMIILFPDSTSAIPKPNDLIINGTAEYRVISNNPMYAGSEIAFNMVQGRLI